MKHKKGNLRTPYMKRKPQSFLGAGSAALLKWSQSATCGLHNLASELSQASSVEAKVSDSSKCTKDTSDD